MLQPMLQLTSKDVRNNGTSHPAFQTATCDSRQLWFTSRFQGGRKLPSATDTTNRQLSFKPGQMLKHSLASHELHFQLLQSLHLVQD